MLLAISVTVIILYITKANDDNVILKNAKNDFKEVLSYSNISHTEQDCFASKFFNYSDNNPLKIGVITGLMCNDFKIPKGENDTKVDNVCSKYMNAFRQVAKDCDIAPTPSE